MSGDLFSVVVVGVTGDGKSTTGNTLVGRDEFQVSGGLCSETSICSHADYLYLGSGVRETRVIDTIGLSDTGLSAAAVMERFSKFSSLCPRGIACVVF